MVWAAISFYGTSSMVFLDGVKDSEVYFNSLEDCFLPIAADKFGEMTTRHFQHNGAS